MNLGNIGNINDVIVKQDRYDELIRKEAMLDNIVRLHKKTSGYSFHDVVGYLLDAAVRKETVEADE